MQPQKPTFYTLYGQKIAGTSDPEKLAIYIQRPGDTAGIDAGNIEDLAKQFVLRGWRIDKCDTVQTITPVIVNEWAPKPWAQSKGIGQLVEKAPMIIYRGVSGDELNLFFAEYQKNLPSS